MVPSKVSSGINSFCIGIRFPSYPLFSISLRPEKKWYSNLHWLSPADEKAHEHYLQTLSASGFDDMLAGIGNYLGLDHLVVFHVTFIAVSQSTRGYVHTDVSNTGVRTFNIIVPLLKAKDSPPELDIQENEEPHRIGRYGYEYNVAGLMGDDVSADCLHQLESRLFCSFSLTTFFHLKHSLGMALRQLTTECLRTCA